MLEAANIVLVILLRLKLAKQLIAKVCLVHIFENSQALKVVFQYHHIFLLFWVKDSTKLEKDIPVSNCQSKALSAVTGTWQPWGEWTQCSVSCNQGSRSRLRRCNDSTFEGGSERCTGEPAEAEVCQTTDCKGMFGFPRHKSLGNATK